MRVGVLLVFGGSAAADRHGVLRAVCGRFRGLRLWLGTDIPQPGISEGPGEDLVLEEQGFLPTS